MCGAEHPEMPGTVCVKHSGDRHDNGFGVSWIVEYRPTQEAVDWARSCVEKEIARYRRFEQEAFRAGKPDSAKRWRFAANAMEHDLIGSGCVIGPFNERVVEVTEALDRAVQHG